MQFGEYKMEIKLTETQRGFLRGEFKDLYGADCSIQESSLATDNAIWLGCENGTHYIDARPMLKADETFTCSARMHLNQEQVKELLPILQYFVEHGTLPK
jgi:hypothetical protein